MLTTSLLLATSVAVQTPAPPQAEPQPQRFSYSFVQASYARTDIDGFDNEADGIGVSVSVEAGPQLFFFAGVGFTSVGVFIIDLGTGNVVGEDDLETTTISGGVGFHHPLAEHTDFVADVAIGRLEAEVDSLDLSDSTTIWTIEAGVRHLIDPRFELNGFVGLSDGSDVDSEFGVAAGARYYATPQLSVGLGVTAFDDSTSFGASLRWQW